MSDDPSYELQVAIITRLKATSDVTTLVSTRIYDRIPPDGTKAVFPYISFGPEQEIPEHIDCVDGGAIFLQIDIWSQAVGRREAKKIAKAIKVALDDADLTFSDNALVCISYEGRQVMTDPDGLTTHIAMTFQATVEEH